MLLYEWYWDPFGSAWLMTFFYDPLLFNFVSFSSSSKPNKTGFSMFCSELRLKSPIFLTLDLLPYYWISCVKPLDFIIPLFFCSEFLWTSITLGWTEGCYILTLIICYFFGGNGGINIFSFCFNWCFAKSLLLYLGNKNGVLLRSPFTLCFSIIFGEPTAAI